MDQAEQELVANLAKAVLIMAALGNMPDSYWLTDSRVRLACQTLGIQPEQAREMARAEAARP